MAQTGHAPHKKGQDKVKRQHLNSQLFSGLGRTREDGNQIDYQDMVTTGPVFQTQLDK